MENKKLPLPPFGGIMQAYQDARIFPKDYATSWDIYLGRDAHHVAKLQMESQLGLCCYLPYGQDYEKFYWPIQDQNIVLINLGFVTTSLVKKMSLHLISIYKPKSLSAFAGVLDRNNKFYPIDQIILFKK